MDKGSYTFGQLESKYDKFLAPSFEISVGGVTLDSTIVPISQLRIDIDGGAGAKAGGCSFVVEALYNYETGSWGEDIMDVLEVGAILKVKVGYVKKKQVFMGFVDDITISYSADSSPTISVSGIDAKGYLMNAKDQQYMSEKSSAEVVKTLLNECKSKGFATKVTVGTLKDFKAQLVQDEIDDYQLLCFLAEMYGMTFLVINGELIFDDLMSNTSSIITLTWGVSLISFSKTMSLRKQVGKVIVYGIDPKTSKEISGEATSTSIGGSGEEAGDTASAFDSIVEKENNRFVQTDEECKTLAQARFNAIAFGYVSGRGTCIGLPELIPGRYIKLEGMDASCCDTYFITKVTHEFSDEGYFTTFDVKGAKSK